MKPVSEWSDDELIGYCDIHCESERALFSAEMIQRMQRLAGIEPQIELEGFYSMHEDMKTLCAEARYNLSMQASA
jgi:hypothetical protein